VGEQQVDHGVGVVEGVLVDSGLGEGGVAADHVRWWIVDRLQYPDQVLPVQGVLQVLDDVELDATFLEQAEGATGLPSAGVVDEQEPAGIEGGHGRRPYRAGLRSAGPEVVESSE